MVVQNSRISGPPPGRGTMTSSRLKINLGKDAVKFALKGDWPRAVELNRAILELCPEDSEAANRLAKALIELGDYPGARSVLEELCVRCPNNSIANKNLSRLGRLESAGAGRPGDSPGAAEMSPSFIEDGGKSCITHLRRKARETVPPDVAGGDLVTLSMDTESVTALSACGRRLGVVEPKLARRLRKLISGGNRYTAAIVGVSGDDVSIIIRESAQHPSMRNVVSFPRRDAALTTTRILEPDASPTPDDEAAENSLAVNEDAGTAEDEEVLPLLATDDIDDDDDADDSNAVPVLETEDVGADPILEMVPAQHEDWEEDQ